MSEIENRFAQVFSQSLDGMYGTGVMLNALKYESISTGPFDVFLKTINDFYSKEINSLFRPYPLSLIEIILSLYLKNNCKNQEVTNCFTTIFKQSVDGTKNTCIKDKYLNMLDSAHAFKQGIESNNSLIVWELAKNHFLSNNEFLNILVGVILINYRFSIGKDYKFSTLDNKYGNKVNELKELNPNETCYIYFLELLRPDIRNAIGHQTIWYDKSKLIVRYEDENKERKSIAIKDFILINSKCSYLGEAYLVAIGTIAILKNGSIDDKEKLPSELLTLVQNLISTEV